MTNYFFGLLIAATFLTTPLAAVQPSADSSRQRSSRIETADGDTEAASGYFSVGALTEDLRRVNVVAYVDAKKIVVGDSMGEPDCALNTGRGYCKYLVTAEVKEVFKGDLTIKTIEIYETADAGYPKANFLGERVVFLLGGQGELAGRRPFSTMENSFRPIKFDVLAKLRRIADPRAAADDDDPTDPFSMSALAKNYAEADAVVIAKGISSRGTLKDGSITAAAVTATVETSLKGDLRAAQSFEYEDDLLFRPYHTTDLGRQVIFLRRDVRNGEVVYERTGGTFGTIKPGVLANLRSIARKQP